MSRARAAALMAVLALACARPMAPPGGDRDVAPPRLLSTTPEPLAVIAPGNAAVVFRFDERLSEREFSEALVTVSPLDSTLRVQRSRQEVRVRIDGGWRPNRVYRVVLLPGVRDRFGNARREATEIVFSTGAPVGNTALAGMVLDRITGAPAARGVVEAVQRTENARYTAVADSTGFFSLRYLPSGTYDVHAFDDQNRNRRRDWLEPVDSGYIAEFAQPADTVTLEFNVLSPDTTGPRVSEATVLDSVHVGVELDDAIDPTTAIAAIGAEVHQLPDSSRYAGAARVMTEVELEAELSAAADTVVAAPAAPAVQRPVRRIIVRLDRPLVPGTYTITVGNITNLHGLTGGGTVRFEMAEPPPPPPPPPPAPPDTIPFTRLR